MTVPVVSICCITYNHAKYIRDALEGFLMQKTSFPVEILIHDDASTDGTADIIREYEAKYPDIIKPIYQTVNQYSQGKDVSQFNFNRVQGKYIALCEGDDFWTNPDKLQIQHDFMESHPDYSMCFGEALLSTAEQEEVKFVFAKLENREYAAREFFEHWLIATCTTYLKRECIETETYKRISSDRRFVYGDLSLWMTASSLGKVFGFNLVFGQYNQHPGGITQKKLSYEWRKRLVLYAEAMHETFPITDCWDDSFGAGNAYALAKQKLVRLQFVDAWNLISFSRRLAPSVCYLWLKKDLRRLATAISFRHLGN